MTVQHYDSPKVSVLTVVWNGEKFIADAIESILQQSFKDFEYILVNDGSTDGTPQILDEYSHLDRRIRIMHQTRTGYPEIMNVALSLARGEYIAVLDADDIAYPSRLEKQTAFLDEHPEVGFVGGAEVGFDMESGRMWVIHHPTEDSEIRHNWVRRQVYTHSAIMMRRTALEVVGGYDNRIFIGADADLLARIAEHCKVVNLPDPVMIRRYHQDQMVEMKRLQEIPRRFKLHHYAIRRLHLPKSRYFYALISSLGVVLPSSFKRFYRSILGQHEYVGPEVLDERLKRFIHKGETQDK